MQTNEKEWIERAEYIIDKIYDITVENASNPQVNSPAISNALVPLLTNTAEWFGHHPEWDARVKLTNDLRSQYQNYDETSSSKFTWYHTKALKNYCAKHPTPDVLYNEKHTYRYDSKASNDETNAKFKRDCIMYEKYGMTKQRHLKSEHYLAFDYNGTYKSMDVTDFVELFDLPDLCLCLVANCAHSAGKYTSIIDTIASLPLEYGQKIHEIGALVLNALENSPALKQKAQIDSKEELDMLNESTAHCNAIDEGLKSVDVLNPMAAIINPNDKITYDTIVIAMAASLESNLPKLDSIFNTRLTRDMIGIIISISGFIRTIDDKIDKDRHEQLKTIHFADIKDDDAEMVAPQPTFKH